MLLADLPVVPQVSLLDAGYRQMYNLEFDAAHRSFQEWMNKHPDDPMGPVSDAAAYLFAEFDRLHILQSEFFLHDDAFLDRAKPSPDQKLKHRFEASLERARQVAGSILVREPRNENARLATVFRLGLHADYLGLIEKKYLSALSEMKAGRKSAEILIAGNPNFGDAYLAVGVENYLLSLKPAPLRWFLRLGGAQTEKERGIKDLLLTVEHGHYLVPYARVLLAVAALRDKDTGRAKALLQDLAAEFPHNRLYAEEIGRLQ